eukprot:m.105116 g.105116  ORF g.105116 m.105116 type:complete len:117 (+) comp15691_c0_seq1:1443-1793(+)
MEFSEGMRHTGTSTCRLSPDGQFVAGAVGHKLVIRNTADLSVIRVQQCLDAIQHLEWSNDSLYVLCALYKRAVVQVYAVEDTDWRCKIDEGEAGLIHARWSPDGRHIITTAEDLVW